MSVINEKCHTNVDCFALPSCATFDVAMANNTTADNWIRFGRWVFEKREARGLRQEDLAEKIEANRQTIYRIEKGSSTKRATVVKIAIALGQNPEVALGIAFGVALGEVKPKGLSAEEVLKDAQYFHAKGMSEADLAIIRPILKALDEQVEALAKD